MTAKENVDGVTAESVLPEREPTSVDGFPLDDDGFYTAYATGWVPTMEVSNGSFEDSSNR